MGLPVVQGCSGSMQVLLKWINKTGPEATYMRLIQALYVNDDLPTVEAVCRMITPDKGTYGIQSWFLVVTIHELP